MAKTPVTPDQEAQVEQAIAMSIRDRQELIERATKAEATGASWYDRATALEAEVNRLQDQFKIVQSQRDYYMRYATELVTRLTDAINILNVVKDTADEEARRPGLRRSSLANNQAAEETGAEASKSTASGAGNSETHRAN